MHDHPLPSYYDPIRVYRRGSITVEVFATLAEAQAVLSIARSRCLAATIVRVGGAYEVRITERAI